MTSDLEGDMSFYGRQLSDDEDDSDYQSATDLTRRVQAATAASEKEDIVTKYADKINTEPFKKGPQVTKDRANRATVEQVLDPRTLRFLAKIINSNLMSRINGCISTGKEANVYHGTHDDAEVETEFAVKIYKTSILVFKDRKRYVDGDFRLRNSKDQGNPRKMVKIWAEKEYRNLCRIHQSKVPCPRPYMIKSHVLVMQFLTEGDGQPSPKVKDYDFQDGEEVERYYKEMLICMRRLFQDCRLVHADLSEYNSIIHDDKLYIIDVSQSVEPDHPMALDFLRMDIKNVNDFFGKKGINIYPEKSIFSFITASDKQLKLDTRDDEQLKAHIGAMTLKTTPEQEVEDEVFRSLHLVRSLNQLDERDFQKFSEGKVETLDVLVSTERTLVGEQRGDSNNAPEVNNKQVHGAEEEEEDEEEEELESETDSGSGSDSDSDSDSDGDSDNELGGASTGKVWKERDAAKPKGKKYEDKDEKRARKEAAKVAKQERRKTKMKKHLKKKIINKRKS
ncbi:uncharacterized protein LODBEIA_P06940 [Lodderomyces beijingensis]|uniref:Serine/threonine-protein kinase RIO1 n=1 Tax=Lodderomyces beijingensis TaxID=1775926 RepID=A0ABP0ZH50_9ASCO